MYKFCWLYIYISWENTPYSKTMTIAHYGAIQLKMYNWGFVKVHGGLTYAYLVSDIVSNLEQLTSTVIEGINEHGIYYII